MSSPVCKNTTSVGLKAPRMLLRHTRNFHGTWWGWKIDTQASIVGKYRPLTYLRMPRPLPRPRPRPPMPIPLPAIALAAFWPSGASDRGFLTVSSTDSTCTQDLQRSRKDFSPPTVCEKRSVGEMREAHQSHSSSQVVRAKVGLVSITHQICRFGCGCDGIALNYSRLPDKGLVCVSNAACRTQVSLAFNKPSH